MADDSRPGGQASVGRRIAASGRRARHGLGPDHVPRSTDEQLGAGAEEPVDVEQEAAGVGGPQASEEHRSVERHVGLDEHLAGEHDLVELAGRGVAHGLGGVGDELAPPLRRSHGPYRHLPGERAEARRATGVHSVPASTSGASAAPIVVTHRVPSSARPHTTSGMTSSVVGIRAEGERAEGHRARAGDADGIVDLDGRQRLVDGVDGDPRRHAAAGEPDARPFEQQAVGAGQLEQVEVVVDPTRAGDERGHGASGSRRAVTSWAIPTDSSVRSTSVKPALRS